MRMLDIRHLGRVAGPRSLISSPRTSVPAFQSGREGEGSLLSEMLQLLLSSCLYISVASVLVYTIYHFRKNIKVRVLRFCWKKWNSSLLN